MNEPELKTGEPITLTPQHWLDVCCNGVRVGFIARRPNVWRRFWHWALLGWKWENL